MYNNPYDWFQQTKITAENISVLKRIQQGFPSAIIAGGAIRDHFHEVGISDIDIFVCHPRFSNDYPNVPQDEKNKIRFAEADITEMFNLHNDDYVEAAHNESTKIDGGENCKHIMAVWNVYKDEVKYQLIILKREPLEYVNKYFDIGLCKAYCDGTKIRYTSEFLDDAHNETLTVTGDMSEEEFKYCMAHHVQRIHEKYPNFSVVVDPKLRKYQKGVVIPSS